MLLYMLWLAAPIGVARGSQVGATVRPIPLLTLSLLTLSLKLSGKCPMGLGILPLEIMIMLESYPLKSTMLVGGWAVSNTNNTNKQCCQEITNQPNNDHNNDTTTTTTTNDNDHTNIYYCNSSATNNQHTNERIHTNDETTNTTTNNHSANTIVGAMVLLLGITGGSCPIGYANSYIYIYIYIKVIIVLTLIILIITIYCVSSVCYSPCQCPASCFRSQSTNTCLIIISSSSSMTSSMNSSTLNLRTPLPGWRRCCCSTSWAASSWQPPRAWDREPKDVYLDQCIPSVFRNNTCCLQAPLEPGRFIRPISLLTLWVSEGLTQACSLL